MNKDCPRDTPGPGAYAHRGINGTQPSSSIRTQPNYSLGTEKRFADLAAKAQKGVPGPGAYFY